MQVKKHLVFFYLKLLERICPQTVLPQFGNPQPFRAAFGVAPARARHCLKNFSLVL